MSESQSELERIGLRMQREAYERAGAQARRLGVRRKDNPFLRADATPAEQERLSTLAAHWWRGWDSLQPYVSSRGRAAIQPNTTGH